jgi:hypothetical protein
MFSSFSAALFVCGGSGITFGLAATQEVIRDAFDRSSRIRLVDLIWIVPDPEAAISFMPTFVRLMEQAEAITSMSLRISIHYTRASATTQVLVDANVRMPEGIDLLPGRPDLGDILSSSVGCASVLKATTLTGVHGVVVAVCGPDELVESARAAEASIGKAVRKAVGGVELVEECVIFSPDFHVSLVD